MEAKLALFLIFAIVSAEWHGVESFSGGAPSAACSTLSPDPAQHGAQPQPSSVPYNIDISQLTGAGGYTPGQTYTLTLTGNSGEQFRGLLVQTRTVAGDSPVGTFIVTDAANTELSACAPANIGITHSNGNVKDSVSFQWTAPPPGTGPIRFRFAVVLIRDTYWADQSSAMVQELVAMPEATTTTAGQDVTSMGPQTTMVAADTGTTTVGQPGGATDMQEGDMTTLDEQDPTSSAMKQSGVGFWTLILLMITVCKTIMRTL